MNKAIIAGFVVVLAIAVGGYFFPKFTALVGAPAAGNSFTTAKRYTVNMAPTSATATSSTLYNSDANDRIIQDAFVSCSPALGTMFAQTGAGIANFTITAATTSTATATNLDANIVNLLMNVNVSTSTTDDAYAATTTYAKNIWRRWKAGSYITFIANATSSNSVTCNMGVDALTQ